MLDILVLVCVKQHKLVQYIAYKKAQLTQREARDSLDSTQVTKSAPI